MAYEVIRISCHNEPAITRLVLEGKLAGACVDELDKCWHESPAKWSTLLIDLTSVSFIDDRGKQLLKQMHDHGAKLISNSLMSRCLIEEIEVSHKKPRKTQNRRQSKLDLQKAKI